MNAFETMKMCGFGGGALPAALSTFITTASIVSMDVISTNGTTLTVDWGDGTAKEDFAMTGSSVDVVRDYGSGATRTIVFSGNGNAPTTSLDFNGADMVSIDVSQNTALTHLRCDSCAL